MSEATTYAWKAGSRAPVSAQLAGEELSRIRAEQGRFFTPAAVVHASRDPVAPLHDAFTWNNRDAAAAHREEEARYLIRHIVVVHTGSDLPPTRAFVSVQTDGNAHLFTTMAHALSDADLREQVLGRALAEMRAFEQKYRQYLNLSGVLDTFNAALAQAARPGIKPDS